MCHIHPRGYTLFQVSPLVPHYYKKSFVLDFSGDLSKDLGSAISLGEEFDEIFQVPGSEEAMLREFDLESIRREEFQMLNDNSVTILDNQTEDGFRQDQLT